MFSNLKNNFYLKFMKKYIAVLIVFSFLILLPMACAEAKGLGDAMGNLQQAAGDTGLESNLTSSVGTIIKIALGTLGTVFLILMVYAGYLWMTAAGDEKKTTKAKDIIKAAVIGLVITVSAYAITSFVTTKIAGGSSAASEAGASN